MVHTAASLGFIPKVMGKTRIFLKFTSPKGTVSQCKCIGLPTVNMAHNTATTTKTI